MNFQSSYAEVVNWKINSLKVIFNRSPLNIKTLIYMAVGLYTVKTGIFSISFPQTVPLQITDLLCKHMGNTVFVYWHKLVCVIT